MKLIEFAAALNLSEACQTFIANHGWDAAEACYSDKIEALEDDFILAQLAKLHRKEDFAPILEAAKRARAHELAKHCFHYLTYYWWLSPNPVMYGGILPDFSMIPDLGTTGEILGLLAALSGIPCIEKTYAKLGLPPEYARNTIQYITGGIDEHRAGHNGRIGFGANLSKLHWLRFYIDGKLFRIGRFEFMIQDPHESLPAAYRSKIDNHVVALCRNGWRLNREGLRLWVDEDPKTAYKVAALECDESFITGIPVNPRGFAEVDKTVTLDLGEYEPLWSPWDLVLGMHIPAGGGMTPELCQKSFEEALAFFPKYFRRKVAAFSCFSWIFNPDFERLLPESNLAKLMREVYLFPFPSWGVDGLVFVFGKSAEDWSDFPADNTLRRAFHQLRLEGKRLKTGGMFLTADAVKTFGKQTFRK